MSSVKSKSSKSKSAQSEDVPTFKFKVTTVVCCPTASDLPEDEKDPDALLGGAGGGSISGPSQPRGSTAGGTTKSKRVMEAPKANNYFHFQYQLLPNEEIIKTDVVTYGVAAKIYTEKMEPKVLKTWRDGDFTWVAWTNTHTITVTEETLMEIFTHQVELKIWDTKDKLSTRARFDRPKAFKLPTKKGHESEDAASAAAAAGGGVRALVLKQSKNYEGQMPKKPADQDLELPGSESFTESRGEYIARLNAKKSMMPDSNRNGEIERINDLPAVKSDETGPSDSDPNKRSDTHPETAPPPAESAAAHGGEVPKPAAGLLLEPPRPHMPGPDSTFNNSFISHGVSSNDGQQGNGGKSGRSMSRASNRSRAASRNVIKTISKKAEAKAAAEAERIKKNGIGGVSLKLNKLFAGIQMLTERLSAPVNDICDVFFSVSLAGPLMSDEQKRKFNPMVVKVHSVTNMPETPLNYTQLRERCEDAYLRYQLFNQPEVKTVGRPHAKNLYWDDVHVMLTGLMSPAELKEYLVGAPLTVELHDRDRKLDTRRRLTAKLFGDDLEDEKISNAGVVTSKRTLYNAFGSEKDRPWDPYGVAKFDLSGLLLGQTVLHMKSPVHLVAAPDTLPNLDDQDGDPLVGVPGSVDGPTDKPMPSGNYVDAQTMIKVRVELAYPIISPREVAEKPSVETTEECPFSRIVFRFAYNNTAFLQKLQKLVLTTNAHALGLEEMPLHVAENALSTYRLSQDERESRWLDILSGFHVMDGTQHLVVLEGQRDGAIPRLWEAIPRPYDEDVTILYNSDLAFSTRLYGELEADIFRIKLHEPIPEIMSQPLLYVRDMLPKACFQALAKLNELTREKTLRSAIRNDLLPTADMVLLMNREFGVPITQEDKDELALTTPPPPPQLNPGGDATSPAAARHKAGRREWTPLDMYNDTYEEQMEKRMREGGDKDFHQENLKVIRRKSEKSREQQAATRPATIRVETAPAHNYSTQTLNTTEQAKEKLRGQMAATAPHRMFTYNPEFHHSHTVVPINEDTIEKQQQLESAARWKTPAGWTFPGKKSMIQANQHHLKPDTARLDELYQPWQQGSLHSTHLEPTLPERDTYGWDRRKADMDTWTRPPGVFGVNDPITIHLAGIRRQAEKLEAEEADMKEWKKKLVVSDARGHFHRLLPETELTSAGRNASNQLDRLTGLLKDPPARPPARAKAKYSDNPPLGVVMYPSVDTAARAAGAPLPSVGPPPPRSRGFNPGPYEDFSWTLAQNMVPVKDYEHDKFREAYGQDFNVYHKERSAQYKRPIPPLKDKKYDAAMFRWPADEEYTIQFRRSYAVPDNVEMNFTADKAKRPAAGARTRTMDSGLGASLPSTAAALNTRDNTVVNRPAVAAL